MALYLLDTTTLTHLRRGHPRVTAAYTYHRQPASGDAVGVASVNVEEVVNGWLGYLRQARTPTGEERASLLLNEAITFLGGFKLCAVTVASVVRYQNLHKLRLNVGRNDLRLAALALELGAIVVTDNVQDFRRVPGLAWVDWTK